MYMYSHTLSLHDALSIWLGRSSRRIERCGRRRALGFGLNGNLLLGAGHEDAVEDGETAADLDRGQGLAQDEPGEDSRGDRIDQQADRGERRSEEHTSEHQ